MSSSQNKSMQRNNCKININEWILIFHHQTKHCTIRSNEACEKLSHVTAYAGDFPQNVPLIRTKISELEGNFSRKIKKFPKTDFGRGTSHNSFYQLKPKSQIWKDSFREKSKSFKKRSKNRKFDFWRAII